MNLKEPSSEEVEPTEQEGQAPPSTEASYDVSTLVDQIDNILILIPSSPSSKTRETLALMYDSLSKAVEARSEGRSVSAFMNLFGCLNVLVKASPLGEDNTTLFERSMGLIEHFEGRVPESIYKEYKKALQENYNAYRSRFISHSLMKSTSLLRSRPTGLR